jgi:uncharacterized protein
MPNRLAQETSPYLLQHADNPVDWYPWGEEAFAKARAEDKPILLSVGYSACHWCHVMAHESFENETIAGLMNQWFVNVKVDREERPDVDGVYMTAVQALTGQGGWPMTVFITTDGKPFYGGTYFPPEDMHGRPGFPRLLEALHNAWETDREKLTESAENITAHLQETSRRRQGALELSKDLPAQAVQQFRANFDETFGGFGTAPKFPSPGNLEFLLAYHARASREGTDDGEALAMALHTLRGMASGGMYDQLGGGFARYSVDQEWLVPHFEKMLYDNAQLARVYLHAFQLTDDPYYLLIAGETLDYLLDEMQDPSGGFYSAQDADSEGIEGKFFVWTLGEVQRALGTDAALFAAAFGVTAQGNFVDPHHPELLSRNVLTRRYDSEELAARFGLTSDDFETKLAELRQRMLEHRSERVRPGLDDKVLTSWNGLALAAFAEAARVLDEDRYREAALNNAEFVRRELWRDGRLLHTWKDGRGRIDGMLEDYAFYGLGLIELYKLTGDPEHLAWAKELFAAVVERFRDGDGGGFFETPADGETLLLRQKEIFDQATPSGNGAAAMLALWLGRYYGERDWDGLAEESVSLAAEYLLQAPTGFGTAWQAIEFMLAPHRELVIIGEREARADLENVAAILYDPWLAVAPGRAGTELALFEGRDAGPSGAQAYLCRDMACQMPTSDPRVLAGQLGIAVEVAGEE